MSSGLRGTRGEPVSECVNDGQTKDEQGDTCQDLQTAFLGLEANLAGRGEQHHEREDVVAGRT